MRRGRSLPRRRTNMTENLKAKMRLFEESINTANVELMNELVAPDAPFLTPAADHPVYGGEGYMSIVYWVRERLPDAQWHIVDMVCEGRTVAVYWDHTGTHTGAPYLGIPAKGKKMRARFMNFYYFNDKDRIVNDIAAEGMIAVMRCLQD
jgi:steroid delta-isomerase-like uncharacterized protein